MTLDSRGTGAEVVAVESVTIRLECKKTERNICMALLPRKLNRRLLPTILLP